MLFMIKRVFRGVIKVIAIAAGIVFIFDNQLSGVAGTVLLGSIAVLGVCLLFWLIFDLDENAAAKTNKLQQ
jgi:hypothetical protein